MKDSTLRSRYVMAQGIKTHYSEVGGDGPVLVALHGGGAGSSGAAGMGPLMRMLASDFRVIALDSIGGFGDTDPLAPSPYGLQSRVDHLSAFVDALCLDRFSLFGNSQGAWVGAKYAVMRPDRVERLAMVASNTIPEAMGLEPEMNASRAKIFNFDGSREAMRAMVQSLVYNQETVTDELIDARLRNISRPGALDSFKAAMAANKILRTDPAMRANFDLSHSLPALTRKIPSIMIWGLNDTGAPPELGRALEPLLPDVKFHWFDKAAHQVQNDQPEAVAQLLREFILGPQKLALAA